MASPNPQDHPVGTAEPRATTGKALQSEMLNQWRRDATCLDLFLVNGVRLSGTIRAFDQYCIQFEGERGRNLVYKHAISTLGPAGRGTSAQSGRASARTAEAKRAGRT